MRKKVFITMIIIFALALTGCGRARDAARPDESAKQQAVPNPGQNVNNPAAAAGSSASNQASGSTAIVAKSGNIVSSSDKEALLNDVDKELDALLNDVNNLEDVQDTDLNLNQR